MRKREGFESMKVTRLKKGYRINLSDFEYSLLAHEIIPEGMGSGTFVDEEWGHLHPAEQRICTEIVNGTRDWWVVTEDRRGQRK